MGPIYRNSIEVPSTRYATKAIESYKKALCAGILRRYIGDRLAEMYMEGQRIHDAVGGPGSAGNPLKREPGQRAIAASAWAIYLRIPVRCHRGQWPAETGGPRHRATAR